MKTVSYELASELLDVLKSMLRADDDDLEETHGSYRLEMAREAIAKAETAMVEGASDADRWIKWEGGKRPVDADTLVDCKLRDGYVEGCQKASLFDWSDIDSDTDIIAYRIVEGG